MVAHLPQDVRESLLNLDRVGRTLDPDFDPNDAVRRNAADLMTRQMWQSASPSNVFAAALEAKEFAEKLPGRVNQIAEDLANGEFTVNVESLDEGRLVNGLLLSIIFDGRRGPPR